MDKHPGSVSLRHSSAIWVPAVIWVFCLFVLIDAVAEGTATYALRVAFLVAAFALLVYLVLAKPALILDNDGVTVANVLRTHRIPFGALLDVRVRGLAALVARTADGGQRTITTMNAPGVKRLAMTGEGEVERAIRNRWEAWEQSPRTTDGLERVTSSWNNRDGIAVIAVIAANTAIRLQ
jgi:hypothetical protein